MVRPLANALFRRLVYILSSFNASLIFSGVSSPSISSCSNSENVAPISRTDPAAANAYGSVAAAPAIAPGTAPTPPAKAPEPAPTAAPEPITEPAATKESLLVPIDVIELIITSGITCNPDLANPITTPIKPFPFSS